MNYKHAIALVIIFLGMVLVVEASWKIYKMDDIKDDVTEVISPFTNEKAQSEINNILENSYGYNKKRIYSTLIGGIALVVVGSGLLYFFRKKR